MQNQEICTGRVFRDNYNSKWGRMPQFYQISVNDISILTDCDARDCQPNQKSFFCFCFGKSSKTSGGRELALALPLFCPAVSPARATPLPGCGARSGERIALRTTEHLKASVSTRLLHAASVLAQTGAAPVQNPLPEYSINQSGRVSR